MQGFFDADDFGIIFRKRNGGDTIFIFLTATKELPSNLKFAD
jgi:hypothetical protein